MLLEEWDWDEAKEVWQEEAMEMAEAKYQPVIAEKDRSIEERDRSIEQKDRENEWLRQKLREAGIDLRQN
jgi:hypothetical protein